MNLPPGYCISLHLNLIFYFNLVKRYYRGHHWHDDVWLGIPALHRASNGQGLCLWDMNSVGMLVHTCRDLLKGRTQPSSLRSSGDPGSVCLVALSSSGISISSAWLKIIHHHFIYIPTQGKRGSKAEATSILGHDPEITDVLLTRS